MRTIDPDMDPRRAAILAEIPRLRRYARGLLRDVDAADDLVQDCLERALKRIENWRTGDSPRRWLFTIMHHLFVDQARSRKRRVGAGTMTIEEGEALAPPAPGGSVLAAMEIMEALQVIAPERRAALLMVAVEGFSYAEAAQVLGVPAGTLMSRIARGRDDLRAVLDDGARRRAIKVVLK